MIRNWLGSTTDDEFYEACDKYGLLVWDDFWLNSNPNLPEDIHCFNFNAIEKIKSFHIYLCGNWHFYCPAKFKSDHYHIAKYQTISENFYRAGRMADFNFSDYHDRPFDSTWTIVRYLGTKTALINWLYNICMCRNCLWLFL